MRHPGRHESRILTDPILAPFHSRSPPVVKTFKRCMTRSRLRRSWASDWFYGASSQAEWLAN